MRVTLEIVSNGEVQKKDLKTGSFLRIGRNEKSQWIIQDKSLSGAHCEFNLRYNRLIVTDLKSKNGTYVNGIRIEQADLFAGDKLKIGETVFIIQKDLMDEEALNILVLSDEKQEKKSNKFRLDFTSARLQNKNIFNGASLVPQNNRKKPLKVAVPVQARKKLSSKEEIKSTHKFEAQMSKMIDCLALIAIIYFPMMITKIYPVTHKGVLFIALELVMISLFLMFNFVMGKFTIGEQVSGIKDICLAR